MTTNKNPESAHDSEVVSATEITVLPDGQIILLNAAELAARRIGRIFKSVLNEGARELGITDEITNISISSNTTKH